MTKPWIDLIHHSNYFFWNKNKLYPNTLLLHPKVRTEIALWVLENKTFTLCDMGVTKFMGCKVIETIHVEDFFWAYVETE